MDAARWLPDGAPSAWYVYFLVDDADAAVATVVEHGGTITHHHAVGRDHRSGYEREVDPLFRRMFGAAKQVADPRGIMNPGVLLDAAPGTRFPAWTG